MIFLCIVLGFLILLILLAIIAPKSFHLERSVVVEKPI